MKHGEVAAILVQLERGAGMERSPSIGGSIKVSIGSQGKSSLGNQAAVRIRKTLQYGQSRAIRIDPEHRAKVGYATSNACSVQPAIVAPYYTRVRIVNVVGGMKYY